MIIGGSVVTAKKWGQEVLDNINYNMKGRAIQKYKILTRCKVITKLN